MIKTNKLKGGISFQDDPEYTNKPKDTQIKFQANRAKTNTQKAMDDAIFGPGAVRRRPKGDQTPSQPAPTPPVPKPPVVQKKQTIKNQPIVKKPSINTSPPPIVKVVEQPPREVVLTGRLGLNRPAYIRKLKKIAENFEYQFLNQSSHTYKDVVRPFQCERNKIQVLERLGSDNTGYHDKEFPATHISVGRNYRNLDVVWKRAQQLTNRAAFGKYVEPNDILIGSISSPSFVSVLSCLAERQRNIKRLIQNQQLNSNGFYYVRLNINSVWRYVNVDDFLPSIQDDNVGLLSFRDNESDIALSIIEKAYAKAYGGYDVFQKNCLPEYYLRDLTGSRVARYSLNDKSTLQNIQEALQQGWTVVAVPNNGIEALGLNGKYNLGVINSSAAGLQFRNSWGTITDRPKVNLSKQGVFQLSLQQASKYFDYILIAETSDNYQTTTVQSKHQPGFYSSYSFKIRQPVEAIVSASQWDRRLFPKGNSYNYSPFRLIIDRKGEGKSQYVAGGFSQSQRNLDVLVSLSPGFYSISCIGSWNRGNAYDYAITLYASHPVNFEKNYTQSFPNLISQSLQEFNLKNGKRSAKGHVDEYILYHQPTNLVLLTNINVSDKPYDYTQDLSRINFESLNLLNAPNHEQRFDNKLQQQVSAKKEDHNTERRWNVHLEPKQAYTWVISTREGFSLNNFKNWGFK